jgi:hypothetical protein
MGPTSENDFWYVEEIIDIDHKSGKTHSFNQVLEVVSNKGNSWRVDILRRHWLRLGLSNRTNKMTAFQPFTWEWKHFQFL